MRIIIDSLIAVMLIAVVVGVVVRNNGREQDERNITTVQQALDRLSEQAAYHTAVQSALERRETLLVHLHEEWFGEDLPTNVLLDDQHPWIDLAPPGDLGVHPPDPVATKPRQAGFWYNPTTKVFRARVTPRASEAETLALYNEINGTDLVEFEQIPDPSRRPIAHDPGTTPTTQYASMANLTWSEPEPTQAEANEKFFAPLLDEIQSKALASEAEQPSADNTDLEPSDTPVQQDSAQTEPAQDGVGDARPTLNKG